MRSTARGSGDMKGAIAALLMAVEALKETGTELAFNIECSFTADEETGGQLGAGWIVNKGLVNARFLRSSARERLGRRSVAATTACCG